MTDWQTIKPWLGSVIRVFLGAVWLWASLAKLHNPRGFVQTVRAYDATPEWLSKAIGYGLPVLEFALAILLILGVAVRLAASTSAVLFVVFLIGLIQASARGIKLECGCFGGGGTTDGSTSYFLDVLRDIGLLAMAIYLIVWTVTYISIEQFMARNDVVVVPSAKRLRSEQGRRKYEAQLAVVQTQARSRTMYVNGSLALITVLVVIIGIGVQSGRAKITGSLTATHATVANGVVYGKKAAATVEVYEDLGCPICEEFETSVHAQLDKDVVANLAQVRFHPISILDRNSPNQYSTRAANAVLCASDNSVDAFVAYHNLLYGSSGGKQVQPKEGTAGPTNFELIGYAKTLTKNFTTAAITTFTTCVNSEQHKPLVEALTDQASKRGVDGTPTVFVNGKKLGSNTLAALSAAIKAADAKGPAPAPSPTATPSASTSGSPSASVTPSTSASPSPSASK
ncbi:MauE/DoxX family redox-associated membrane protein [Jatrophihabitans sp.]|uniref:MauE/DoxX family redox-associated membrane protein n=1 Tax=Jatrophihabitans sp. TaxID=1932789 RepID=UPI0030C7778E|nr:Protein-disulfide isomerase [Jatrophihabitans sp.]